MTHLCVTCGTQYPPASAPPDRCLICQDERQYVGLGGQQWTTLEALRRTHRNTFFQEAPGLWGIYSEPKFGIGQRALLVRAGGRNVLWDCVSLLDGDSIALIDALGGISAIAVSHPHYYSAMVEWSHAFGSVPIYLHEADRQWVMRPDDAIRYWSGGTLDLGDGLTLARIGGHFDGYQVLHSKAAEEGKGALYCGDLPQVCMDRRWVSFMYSYPNYLPLSGAKVRSIAAKLEAFEYDALYGAWPKFVIPSGAKAAVARSAERYLRLLDT